MSDEPTQLPILTDEEHASDDWTVSGHIMLDIETLGIGSNSVVFSIGMIPIFINTNSPVPQYRSGGINRGFYRTLSVGEQINKFNRTVDTSTLVYWSRLPADAQAELLQAMGIGEGFLEETLTAASNWIRYNSVNRGMTPIIWGKGPSFDCTILSNLYRAVGMKVPWLFRDERCVRTADHLLRKALPTVPQEIVHHALHDAHTQAVRLVMTHQELGGRASLFCT